MANVFINGMQFPIGTFLPIINGSSNEDLNMVKTNQIRNYPFSMKDIKNTPLNLNAYFTLIVTMQSSDSGVQFLVANNNPAKLFLRAYVGGWWGQWYLIPLNSVEPN